MRLNDEQNEQKNLVFQTSNYIIHIHFIGLCSYCMSTMISFGHFCLSLSTEEKRHKRVTYAIKLYDKIDHYRHHGLSQMKSSKMFMKSKWFNETTMLKISVICITLKGTYYAKFTFAWCLDINVCWQCVYTTTL